MYTLTGTERISFRRPLETKTLRNFVVFFFFCIYKQFPGRCLQMALSNISVGGHTWFWRMLGNIFFFGLHCTPAVEALSPNHRTSRKFPISVSFLNLANCYRPFFTQACKHINNFISLCLVASVASDSLQPYGLDCQAPLSTEFSRQEYWKG